IAVARRRSASGVVEARRGGGRDLGEGARTGGAAVAALQDVVLDPGVVVRGVPADVDLTRRDTLRGQPRRHARRLRVGHRGERGVHVGLDLSRAERAVVDAHIVDRRLEGEAPPRRPTVTVAGAVVLVWGAGATNLPVSHTAVSVV